MDAWRRMLSETRKKRKIAEKVCRELGIEIVYHKPVVCDPVDYRGLPKVEE